MIETKVIPAEPYPTGFLWFFRNGDTWQAPVINNGLPYLPNVKAQWLRNFYWFCRNPLGNFMGYVIGFQGTGYTVTGPAPVQLTTWRDATPPRNGWKWSIINGWAPFISYNGIVEFYFGWRPTGGFGLKLNFKTALK
jgi:hypothetical protein